jgi:hypothetical protein
LTTNSLLSEQKQCLLYYGNNVDSTFDGAQHYIPTFFNNPEKKMIVGHHYPGQDVVSFIHTGTNHDTLYSEFGKIQLGVKNTYSE